MSVFNDGSISLGTFIAEGHSKDGASLGQFVLEAIQLNPDPDGSGWLIAQINNDWLVVGDTLSTDLRGQFGKITVQTRFSLTRQAAYRTQLIGFGGISAEEFIGAIERHKRQYESASPIKPWQWRQEVFHHQEVFISDEKLTPQNITTRLCALCSAVADKRFSNTEPSDCFCSQRHPQDEFQFSHKVIEFIQSAVSKAIGEWNTPNLTHLCPKFGSTKTACCGINPFELPRHDRLTTDPNLTTCPHYKP